MAGSRRYRVIFANQGRVYEIYAKSVGQGALFGFIEVEELLFGERSQVVVDPGEESLKSEFKGVTRLHIPLHAVVRIDEVEREGVSRVTQSAEGQGKLTPFPAPLYVKPGKDPTRS